MLELLVVIFLCRKIGEEVRPKGYKPLGLQILAVVAWYGTQFGFGFFWGMQGWDDGWGFYVGCIAVGAAAGGSVYVFAKSLPAKNEFDEPVAGSTECPACGERVVNEEVVCPVCGARMPYA